MLQSWVGAVVLSIAVSVLDLHILKSTGFFHCHQRHKCSESSMAPCRCWLWLCHHSEGARQTNWATEEVLLGLIPLGWLQRSLGANLVWLQEARPLE